MRAQIAALSAIDVFFQPGRERAAALRALSMSAPEAMGRSTYTEPSIGLTVRCSRLLIRSDCSGRMFSDEPPRTGRCRSILSGVCVGFGAVSEQAGQDHRV